MPSKMTMPPIASNVRSGEKANIAKQRVLVRRKGRGSHKVMHSFITYLLISQSKSAFVNFTPERDHLISRSKALWILRIKRIPKHHGT